MCGAPDEPASAHELPIQLATINPQMEHVIERTRNSSGLDLIIGSALASVHRPAKLLLPLYGGPRCTLLSCDVAASWCQ